MKEIISLPKHLKVRLGLGRERHSVTLEEENHVTR